MNSEGKKSRADYILANINKDGVGVEIGPSHRPLAPKSMGYRTHVIDHMTKDELKVKYENANVALENIEEVDFVWRGESYVELTKRSKYYNWIIASHVIEHVPNLIGFLSDCDQILQDNGVLSLAIPDSRFCFDHFRPVSSLGGIIDANLEGRRLNSAGMVTEFLLNAVKRGGAITWPRNNTGEFSFIHEVEGVRNAVKRVTEQRVYLDIHVWCFTPHWFRLVIEDLNTLGFIKLREIDFFDPGTHEFYVTLGRQGKGPGISRLNLLRCVTRELSVSDAAI